MGQWPSGGASPRAGWSFFATTRPTNPSRISPVAARVTTGLTGIAQVNRGHPGNLGVNCVQSLTLPPLTLTETPCGIRAPDKSSRRPSAARARAPVHQQEIRLRAEHPLEKGARSSIAAERPAPAAVTAADRRRSSSPPSERNRELKCGMNCGGRSGRGLARTSRSSGVCRRSLGAGGAMAEGGGRHPHLRTGRRRPDPLPQRRLHRPGRRLPRGGLAPWHPRSGGQRLGVV
jgi:hypothetical protein